MRVRWDYEEEVGDEIYVIDVCEAPHHLRVHNVNDDADQVWTLDLRLRQEGATTVLDFAQVMTETLREQEAIVAARLDNANRRRALRETRPSGRLASDEDQQLAMAALALEDRQRALDDRRMLETMRSEAMDVKRRFYLAHCAKGTNNAQN